jgi:hypothetical protein
MAEANPYPHQKNAPFARFAFLDTLIRAPSPEGFFLVVRCTNNLDFGNKEAIYAIVQCTISLSE